MARQNFFTELKRRHVYKVAVAYALVEWLVIQVAATIVPALYLPPASRRELSRSRCLVYQLRW